MIPHTLCDIISLGADVVLCSRTHVRQFTLVHVAKCHSTKSWIMSSYFSIHWFQGNSMCINSWQSTQICPYQMAILPCRLRGTSGCASKLTCDNTPTCIRSVHVTWRCQWVSTTQPVTFTSVSGEDDALACFVLDKSTTLDFNKYIYFLQINDKSASKNMRQQPETEATGSIGSDQQQQLRKRLQLATKVTETIDQWQKQQNNEDQWSANGNISLIDRETCDWWKQWPETAASCSYRWPVMTGDNCDKDQCHRWATVTKDREKQRHLFKKRWYQISVSSMFVVSVCKWIRIMAHSKRHAKYLLTYLPTYVTNQLLIKEWKWNTW